MRPPSFTRGGSRVISSRRPSSMLLIVPSVTFRDVSREAVRDDDVGPP